MGVFLDAAQTWSHLLDCNYELVIGHKHKSEALSLVFRPIDFDHLSGIHKATDIDFGLHRNEYRGDKLIDVLLSGTLNDALIEKSIHWPAIHDRLKVLTALERILDSEFSIYSFSARKLPFHSEIRAGFLVFSDKYQSGVFLFLDQEDNTFYCKSAFVFQSSDYRTNQTRWTVLSKRKTCNGSTQLLYTHPNYRP